MLIRILKDNPPLRKGDFVEAKSIDDHGSAHLELPPIIPKDDYREAFPGELAMSNCILLIDKERTAATWVRLCQTLIESVREYEKFHRNRG